MSAWKWLAATAVATAMVLQGGAAFAAPAGVNDPPVGGGWNYGIARGSIPACNDDDGVIMPSEGGWDRRHALSGSNHASYNPSNPNHVLGWWEVYFDEPCRSSTTTLGFFAVKHGASLANLPSGYTGYHAYGYFREYTFYCQASEWSRTQTTISLAGYTDRREEYPGLSMFRAGLWGGTANATTCPYLSAIHVKWETKGGLPIVELNWSAERYAKGTAYTGKNDITKIGKPDCGEDPDSCSPADLDPTDFSQMCAGQPQPDWPDVPSGFDIGDWLAYSIAWWRSIFDATGATIGHYVTCIFVPAGGWDAEGRIETAWNSSGAMVISDGFELIATTLTPAETCGVFAAAPTGTLFEGFAIDTCDWSPWATPLRELISITLYALFGWWALMFLLQLFLSVVKIAPVPSVAADVTDSGLYMGWKG